MSVKLSFAWLSKTIRVYSFWFFRWSGKKVWIRPSTAVKTSFSVGVGPNPSGLGVASTPLPTGPWTWQALRAFREGFAGWRLRRSKVMKKRPSEIQVRAYHIRTACTEQYLDRIPIKCTYFVSTNAVIDTCIIHRHRSLPANMPPSLWRLYNMHWIFHLDNSWLLNHFRFGN